jgi:hypothetical protein
MVRGTQKQIIHLKNPESPLFEEAFLIVKNSPPAPITSRTMVEEANRLLTEPSAMPSAQAEACPPVSEKRLLRSTLLFLCGAACGALIAVLCLL